MVFTRHQKDASKRRQFLSFSLQLKFDQVFLSLRQRYLPLFDFGKKNDGHIFIQ